MPTMPNKTGTRRLMNRRGRPGVVRPVETSPARALKRYRAAPIADDGDYVQVCISLPIGELERIDAMSKKTQLPRSRFLRKGARMLIAVLEGHDPVRGDG
jgi:hypothetical protein